MLKNMLIVALLAVVVLFGYHHVKLHKEYKALEATIRVERSYNTMVWERLQESKAEALSLNYQLAEMKFESLAQ